MTEPDISEVLAGALLENDQLRARVAELEANAKQREDLIQDNRERIQVLKSRVAELEAQVSEIPDLLLIAHMQGAEQAKDRVAELEAILRRVDIYFQHTGKAGDLPISVHALLPKLINRHEDGTETAVTPLPMWQP